MDENDYSEKRSVMQGLRPYNGRVAYVRYDRYMSTLKTTVSDNNVHDFINAIDDLAKRQDALTLLELFTLVTGEQPKLWGSSIIGFGSYHYKSERSSQKGDWPLVGFSPRKQNFTLYLMDGFDNHTALLDKLGKHKIGKGCLYVKNLVEIDMTVLEDLITASYKAMQQQHS
jgi:hypothetical protein